MVTFSQLFESPRQFMSLVDMQDWLKGKYDDDFSRSDGLLIFDSTRQRTWFIATEKALYCIFDLVSESYPRVNWVIPKEKILDSENNLILSLKDGPLDDRNGIVIIGDKKPRKFSRELFTRIDILSSVRLLIMKAFKVPI